MSTTAVSNCFCLCNLTIRRVGCQSRERAYTTKKTCRDSRRPPLPNTENLRAAYDKSARQPYIAARSVIADLAHTQRQALRTPCRIFGFRQLRTAIRTKYISHSFCSFSFFRIILFMKFRIASRSVMGYNVFIKFIEKENRRYL